MDVYACISTCTNVRVLKKSHGKMCIMKTINTGIVEENVKLLIDSSPGYSTPNPASCQCYWESNRIWPKYPGSFYPCGSFGLLTSVWPSPDHCGHLRIKPVVRWVSLSHTLSISPICSFSLPPPAPSLSLCISHTHTQKKREDRKLEREGGVEGGRKEGRKEGRREIFAMK